MKYLLPIFTLCLLAIIPTIALSRDESAPRLNLILTETGNAQNGLYMVGGVRHPQKLPISNQFNRYSGSSEDGRWLRFWDIDGRLWHYDMQNDKVYALGNQTVRRYIGQVDGWLYLEDHYGIFRVRFDGTDRVDIFVLDSDDTSATFSPDHEWLIYKANLRQFARMKPDGSDHLVLTPADEIHHFDGWSEDGDHFYTMGSLNNENHLTQVNLETGELRVIIVGINKFFGEHDNWLLFERNGKLYRQNIADDRRDVVFEVPDLYVRNVAWNGDWLYVQVLNQDLQQDEIYAVRHDGSERSLIMIARSHAPLIQSPDGMYLASTTPTESLVFISGKHLMPVTSAENGLLLDAWQQYFIFERTLAFGASQYYAQAVEGESPQFLAKRPAGYTVEDFIFVGTSHWNSRLLVLATFGLAGLTMTIASAERWVCRHHHRYS